MGKNNVTRLSWMSAGALAATNAWAQPVTTGLIAADAGHDRIIEFTLPPNELGVLWEGAPLNEPTGMIERHGAVPEPEYWVCNAGDGSIVAFDWMFNSYRTIVEPGVSTVSSPADPGWHYGAHKFLYLLDKDDGAVHRFVIETGLFEDILIAPLAPASSMAVASDSTSHETPVVFIAYPTLGKVIRYHGLTGAMMNTVAEVESPAWVSPTSPESVMLVEDFADPSAPSLLHSYTQEGEFWKTRHPLPSGVAPVDLVRDGSRNMSIILFEDELRNHWTGASIQAGAGSRLNSLIVYKGCYADCDTSGHGYVLDIFDFLCFQNMFVQGEAYACDCDTSTGNGVCDIFDFLCFQSAFVIDCP